MSKKDSIRLRLGAKHRQRLEIIMLQSEARTLSATARGIIDAVWAMMGLDEKKISSLNKKNITSL
jgi:hypothetical protein